jgi:transposase
MPVIRLSDKWIDGALRARNMSRFQRLSDARWSLIEPMSPRPTGRKGKALADPRTMVKAIIYRYRCGIAWRNLPEMFVRRGRCAVASRMATDGIRDTVLAIAADHGRRC